MPPEQTEKQFGLCKRRRRCRSLNASLPSGVVDLTASGEPEKSTSGKHTRSDKVSEIGGPSKRRKLDRDSEPPMPTRTMNYQELKQSKKTLARELWNAEQARKDKTQELKDMTQELEAVKQELEVTRQQLEETQKDGQRKSTDLKRVRKLCDEKFEQLKLKDKIFAELTKQAEAARTLNDSNGSRNEQILNRERNAKDTLRKERTAHRKDISALEKDKAELNQRYQELEIRCRARENDSTQMIARLQLKLQDSLPQSQRFNFKVPDEKVKQDFSRLSSRIRQFVDKYARPVLDITDQELQHLWPSWPPQLRKFVASPLLCSLAFEEYIWEHLLARVFTPWSKIWDDNLGRYLEDTLSMAGEQAGHRGFGSELYVDYQHWRSNSSTFICRLNGEDFRNKNLGPDVEAMVSNLTKLGARGLNETRNADAVEIFKEARDFEVQLRKLKAVYSLNMCKPVVRSGKSTYDVLFDNKVMVDRSPSPIDKNTRDSVAVDFVMSPGLHKRGNNDGDGYEDDTWLHKMGVVCNAAKFLPKSGSSNAARPNSMQVPTAAPLIEVKQEVECHGSGSKSDESSIQTPVSGPESVKFEQTDPLSAPELSLVVSTPELRDATQLQSSAVTNMTTRSQTSLKVDGKVQGGNASTKSKRTHPHPMDQSRGTGAEPCAKRTKRSKAPVSDAGLDAVGTISID